MLATFLVFFFSTATNHDRAVSLGTTTTTAPFASDFLPFLLFSRFRSNCSCVACFDIDAPAGKNCKVRAKHALKTEISRRDQEKRKKERESERGARTGQALQFPLPTRSSSSTLLQLRQLRTVAGRGRGDDAGARGSDARAGRGDSGFHCRFFFERERRGEEEKKFELRADEFLFLSFFASSLLSLSIKI